MPASYLPYLPDQAGNFPAHRTLSDFRAFHLRELGDLFVQVVRLARELGLVKLGTIAVDGTKIKANASRHKAMSYSLMLKAEAQLKKQIDALLERARHADEAERNLPDVDIPAELARREARLAAIAEARQRLERRQREADLERGRDEDDDRRRRGKDGKPKGGRYKREFGVPEANAQENFTDADSRCKPRSASRLPKTQVDRRAAQRMDQERPGVPAVQFARPASCAGRVDAAVRGAELTKNVRLERLLRGQGQSACLSNSSQGRPKPR